VEPLLELAIAIKAAQRELDRRMTEAVQPLGLTAVQADAIVVIGQAEPLSLKELGDLLVAEAGHPSRLVDRLVEAGFVRRSAASDDRAREEVLEVGRQLIGGRDIEPALALLRELLEFSPYAGLVARRAALLDRARS
jgi:MarR family transcriptional regulator, organic hydroperoxide resistance regulator